MTDLEWWVFEGQAQFSIEPNTPHYAARTEVWLIANSNRGHRYIGEFETVEQAVKAARGMRD